MTELYLLSIEEVRSIPEAYCREHFPLRLERSGNYRFEADRLRCIGAGVLMSEVLGIPEEKLLNGPEGKPCFPGSKKKFNLSHSGDYIVLAVSEREVGVDIEAADPRHLDVAKRVFIPEEREWMKEDPEKRFFQLWSLKESVMKACGKGFRLPPESFSVLPLLEGGGIQIEGEEYRAVSLDAISGYGFAVCRKEEPDSRPECPVKLFELKRNNHTFECIPCQI